jgi:CRP-like cAMP-binding protein
MDLLARAAALAACPLFEDLAPAVLIRLAERAHAAALVRGERRTTEDTVWVVASGRLAVAVREGELTSSMLRKRGAPAVAGNVLGMIRVVRAATPIVEVVAEQDCELVGLAIDDVHDVLEEDPAAVTALADRLAALLLEQT